MRGGSYSKIGLTFSQKQNLQREIYSAEDRCLRCGRFSHFVKDCYAISDYLGNFIYDGSDVNDEIYENIESDFNDENYENVESDVNDEIYENIESDVYDDNYENVDFDFYDEINEISNLMLMMIMLIMFWNKKFNIPIKVSF